MQCTTKPDQAPRNDYGTNNKNGWFICNHPAQNITPTSQTNRVLHPAMHAIHAVAVIFALFGHLFCSGFINGRLGFARLGRQLPPLPSAQASSAKKPALLVPLQANENTWQASIEPMLDGLSDAQGNIASLQKLKALANSQTKPNPELLVDEMDGMVGSIVNPRDVADWIWSLGKLGFQASIPKQRALIIKSVQQLYRAKGLSVKDIFLSFDGLLNAGIKLPQLPAELRAGLLKVIDETADQFPSHSLVDIFKALHKLELTWVLIPPSTQEALWQSFERNVPQLMNESYYAALTVQSLGQLIWESSTLSEEQRQLVCKVAMKGINKESPGHTAPARQVCFQTAMTIYGLGMMRMPYDGLSSELKDRMASCLLTTLAGMDGRNVANIFHALGQMGCAWSSVSPALQACFQQVAVNKLPAMQGFNIYSTLQGLARMGAKWTNLNRELLKTIEHLVIVMMQPKQLETASSAHQVTQTIDSLGAMSAPWSSFSQAFQAAAMDAFVLLQDKLNPQQISKFLYGLGLMGAPFQDFSPAFKTAVQKAMYRLSAAPEFFKPQDISNILWGFVRMGVSWDQLPQLPAKELEHVLTRLAPSMIAQGVANSIYGLAVIDASWRVLSSDTFRALASAFEDLPPTTKSQGVANSMYGLTLMCFDFQPTIMGSSSAELEKEQLMWRMIRALVKRFRLLDRDEYSKEGVTQFAIFFEWVFGLPGGMELITEELGSRPVFINPHGVHAPTRLHLALSQALPKALQQLQPAGQFHIVNEFDGLGGHVFTMNMAVHQDGKLIAFVEVDNGYQYSDDGKQRKRVDQLKEFLYAQRFPGVPVRRVRKYCSLLKSGIIGQESAQSVVIVASRLAKETFANAG